MKVSSLVVISYLGYLQTARTELLQPRLNWQTHIERIPPGNQQRFNTEKESLGLDISCNSPLLD